MNGDMDPPEDEPRTVFAPGGGGDTVGERTVFQAGSRSAGGAQIKVGDVLNHMFAVRGFLARGGMGEVFEGANLVTDERVAIKVMLPALADDPGVVTLFRREAQTLTLLHHEAVVQYRVVAVEPELGVLYIVTEFIDGSNLSDALGRLTPDVTELGMLLRRLASGLAAAHQLGAIHRDVAPDNILLGGGELARAKLIDFGIAKDLDPGTATIVGDGFAGKLGYVAPEQLGDFDRTIGPWTDIYSLGLVILALAQGRDPGLGGSLVDAVDKRRAGVDTSAVPLLLRGVLDQMLRPDPTQRLRSMNAVLIALDAAEVPGVPRSRWRTWWPVAAALGVVLVALIGWLALRPHQASKTTMAAPGVGEIVERTRSTIDAALPSVGCTWLSLTDVRSMPNGVRIALTGVAGDPADAQREIDRSLRAQKLPAGEIDFAEVSPINRAGCAALDAYRQVRSDRRSRLSVPQRRFEMQKQSSGRAYAGQLAANAVAVIAMEDPSADFALIGLEPSGKIDMLIPDRAAFAAALRESREGQPITDLGGDRYRLQIDLDHVGWSGLMLVTGKAPFDPKVLAPGFGERGPGWRDQLVSLATERGWQVEMAWFRSVDQLKD